jgi:hypothetical protein
MKPGDFRSIPEMADREAFRASVVRLAEDIGFRTVSAIVVIDRAGESQFLSIDTIPAGFGQQYNDRSAWRRDPVMQHLKSRSLPIVWDQSTYVANGGRQSVLPVGWRRRRGGQRRAGRADRTPSCHWW